MYQLETLRDGPSGSATREWQFPRFTEQLVKAAAERPLLVEALATAPEPELRLIAIDALRAVPLPRFQKLLPALLHDPDEKVRAAAESVQKHWDSLRGNND